MAGNSQMTMEEFRRNRATASASKTGGNVSSLGKYSSADWNKTMDHPRQSSALAKRNATGEDKHEKSVEGRGENAKLLLEKQIEERKKKNEERRAAVEDRRRQKEKEESAKNAIFMQLLDHKTTSASRGIGSGRKLPNLPGIKDGCRPRRETSATRRLSSGSSSGDSPTSHTPPGSTTGNTVSRRSLTGPTSRSTSCLSNVGNGQVQSKTKSNLGNSKKTSSSTNNLTDKPLGNNRPTTNVKEKTVASRAVGVLGLPKAQSTGAIHQLGHGGSKQHLTSRPPSSKKPKAKPSAVHHAGSSNEQEAKLALAERRRKIREEAERQALLDKEKQEELRKQREEEEKRVAEENAKESARQAELAKMLKEQEDERAQVLREQREKEEAERMEAEMKRKEEMELIKKQELERRAKETEKREREEEERLKREEEERQERRKRVEVIMSRTRMTAATSNNSSKMENYSSQEDLSIKTFDDAMHHSTTMSEILQKVKEKSRASPTPEQDAEKYKENEAMLGICGPEKDIGNHQNENTSSVLRIINDTSKLDSLISETKNEEIADSTALLSLPLRQHSEGSRDGAVATRSGVGSGGLWKNVEHFMQSSEHRARDKLEQNGGVAEDDDDEDGEEGQLWKVIEGKREISEVV